MGRGYEEVEVSYKNDICVIAGILLAIGIAVWMIVHIARGEFILGVAPLSLFEIVRVLFSAYLDSRDTKAQK